MKLGTILYAAYSKQKLLCQKGLKIGDPMPLGHGISSLSPNKGGYAAKISSAAKIFDFLFGMEGDFFAYETTSGEVIADIDGIIYKASESGIKTVSISSANQLHALISDVLLKAKEKEEMQNSLKKAVALIARGATAEDEISIFCDTYYQLTKKVTDLELTGGLVNSEVEMAIRNGHAKPMELLKGLQDPANARFRQVKSQTTGEVKEPSPVSPTLLKECLSGRHRIDYEWSSEHQKYIQSYDILDGFVPNRQFELILKKMKFRLGRVLTRMEKMKAAGEEIDRIKAIGKDYINIVLSGKPGTGKTFTAYALSAASGMPIATIPCSHNTDEDDFTGLTKMVDGVPTAVTTDAIWIYEHGGIILLEEFNLPNAGTMMGTWGQAVEFPFIMMKDGYKTIRRHPLCVVIATMNVGTAGSQVPSQPLTNRFRQSYVMDDPSTEDFINILMKTEPDMKACAWVYEAYERITRSIAEDNATADVESILLSLSMRSCIGALENIQEGMEPKEAVEASIIGKISEQDMEVAKNCRDILNTMVDLKTGEKANDDND